MEKRIDFKKCKANAENYPVGIFLNNWMDQILLNKETVITISAGCAKWDLTVIDLLNIMKVQSVVNPYAITDLTGLSFVDRPLKSSQ